MGVIWNSVKFGFNGILDLHSWGWLILSGVLLIGGIFVSGTLAAINGSLALFGFLLTLVLFLYPTARLDRRALELRGAKPREFSLEKYKDYIALIVLNTLMNIFCWLDKKFLAFLGAFMLLTIIGAVSQQTFLFILAIIFLGLWVLGVSYQQFVRASAASFSLLRMRLPPRAYRSHGTS